MSLKKRSDKVCLTLLKIIILLKLVTTAAFCLNESCPFLVSTQVAHSVTLPLQLNEDSEPQCALPQRVN